MDIGLDPRISEGAGEDSVEVASEHGEAVRRDRHAIAKIAVGSPIEFAELNIRPRGLNNFESLREYFSTNAVARNHSDALAGRFLRVHGRKVTQGGRDEYLSGCQNRFAYN